MPSSYRTTLLLLSKNIRKRRESLGLTQEQVAEHMQIAARHYQKIEAAELNVTLRTLCRVADALRTAPSRLLAKE